MEGIRNSGLPCTKCNGKRDLITYPEGKEPFYRCWCRACATKYQRDLRGYGVKVQRYIENPTTDPAIKYYNYPCTQCGGERNRIHHREGVPEYASTCTKCMTRKPSGTTVNRKQYNNELVVSEWDLETEYIFRSVQWRPKVREAVQTTYRRDEISALPCEKMLRILELARKGQVIII